MSFKIGDRVQRIHLSYENMNVGDIGIIIAILANDDCCEIGGYSGFHDQRNLKLIEENVIKSVKRFGIADFVDGLNKK